MTKDLIDVIIEAIQDKKGRNIVVADLTPFSQPLPTLL